ncbi:MAG: tetratricopeptide repeat protein [Parvibaculum sp.]|nr:tetratricopeptide repeat protein [Parvibaculum sp.]
MIPRTKFRFALLACALCVSGLTSAALAAPATVLQNPKDTPPPQSERFRQGVEAYDKGDFATAFKIWLPLAQQADLAAMRNVALMLREGKGTARDPKRALWFYEEAGSKGFTLAQINAAFMHMNGDGVTKNLEAAAFWFHTAALAGSAIAQYNLAVLYERGTGVEKNIGKALGWYALASRNGSKLAVDRLAVLVPDLEGPKPPERTEPSPQDLVVAQPLPDATLPVAEVAAAIKAAPVAAALPAEARLTEDVKAALEAEPLAATPAEEAAPMEADETMPTILPVTKTEADAVTAP